MHFGKSKKECFLPFFHSFNSNRLEISVLSWKLIVISFSLLLLYLSSMKKRGSTAGHHKVLQEAVQVSGVDKTMLSGCYIARGSVFSATVFDTWIRDGRVVTLYPSDFSENS